MAWKIIKIAWGIFCLLFLALMCEDFYQALKYPGHYHFGGEGPVTLWYYETQGLYLWNCVIFFFWFTIGFIVCLLQNKFRNLRWGIAMHLFFTLLYYTILQYFLQ